MTLRFIRLLACQLLLVFACASAQAVDGVEITTARIESSDDGYRLFTNYAFELTPGMELAVERGLSLYFTTEIELTRPRWYWTDDRAVAARRTVKLSYDVLLRIYRVVVPGSIQQTYDTLDQALFAVRRSSWLIAPKGDLKKGETYNVSLRMYLDPQYLQKPLQVDAFNNAEWRLASHKKTFTYRAE